MAAPLSWTKQAGLRGRHAGATVRALKLRVAARPELFVGIAMEFRVFATRNGYVPCDCFLNTGKCRFNNRPGKPCVNFPCGYKHMDFVSTRLAKLE